MNKKISSLSALIILIILSVLIGGIIFWQFFGMSKKEVIIEDETSDWKTYRNKEYGFEFKYPKDWMAGEEGYPEAYLLRRNFFKGDYDISLIIVETLKDDTSFKEYTKGSPDFKINISSSKSNFQGLVYERILGIPSSVGEIMKVIKGNSIYYLTFSGSGTKETDENNLVIFHRILSTFKFL